MSNWFLPHASPIHVQAASRGWSPPIGYPAGALRRLCFDVDVLIPDVARYVADSASPTGHTWECHLWEYLDWYASLVLFDAADRDYVARRAELNGSRYRAASSEPAGLTAEELAGFVGDLPPTVQQAVLESLDGTPVDAATAQELYRATCLGIATCCERVTEKFTRAKSDESAT